MAEERSWRYYGAFVASGLSVLAWLVAAGAVVYTLYALVAGWPIERSIPLAGIGLVAGIVFARVERLLYIPDRSA